MILQIWKCNRLWKVWYAILITFLQGYVTVNGIRQYIHFKSQHYNPRFGEQWDFGPLHFYVICIILAIALLGFFLYFSLVNIHLENCSNIRYRIDEEDQIKGIIDMSKMTLKLMQENIPFSYILHFIISLFLLLPLPVVQMEEIRNEVLSPDSIWSTNIDFFSEHFHWYKTDVLPNSATLRNLHYVKKASVISLEFINFAIASLLLILKLPSVFWLSHRCFSLLYSIFLFFNCLAWLLVFESVSILIKYSGNSNQLEPSNRSKVSISYPILVSLVILIIMLTVLSFVAVFVYGNIQTLVAWVFRYKSVGFKCNGSKKKTGCIIWINATGFLILIFTVIVNSIVFVILFRHFQVYKSIVFIFAIILGIINIVINFLTWFTFAIKTKWSFNLELSKDANHNQNTVYEGYKLSGAVDAIYGCFHNNPSSCSSHSSGPGTIRTLEGASSESNGHGGNFHNHIYMQSTSLQIPTISEDYNENQTNSMKSAHQSRDLTNTSFYGESPSQSETRIDNPEMVHSTENINTDPYRSLPGFHGRKFGKLVKFEHLVEDNSSEVKFCDERYRSNNFHEKDLNFLKVPDILNLSRRELSCSHSELSLDQICSSRSSKNANDPSDQGMCSEV